MARTLSEQLAELALVGCAPFSQGADVGFALPVFADLKADSNALFIQEVDALKGTVSSFRALDGRLDGLTWAGDLTKVRVGDAPIYAFKAGDGTVHTGGLLELKNVLRDFVDKNPHNTGVNLQIAELVGDQTVKRVARAKVQLNIARSDAVAAKEFFVGSVLRESLWARLLDAAPNDNAARRILARRPLIGVRLDDGNLIHLNLAALDPSDFARTSALELTTEIQTEYEQSLSDAANLEGIKETYDPSTIPSDQTRAVQDLVRRVVYTGRQEERIAILLDAIIQNRGIGISALLQYGSDRAMFANKALASIRKAVIGHDTSNSKDELIVASLVPRFFTDSFPMNRGELLYYLARHLAKYPLVNDAIRRRLRSSHSYWVNYFRSEVERILDARN